MPRVVSLASSKLSMSASGWQGQEAYPEPAQKAGLLAARLAKNHPLPDGNKRAAWLAMIEFRPGRLEARRPTQLAGDLFGDRWGRDSASRTVR